MARTFRRAVSLRRERSPGQAGQAANAENMRAIRRPISGARRSGSRPSSKAWSTHSVAKPWTADQGLSSTTAAWDP